MERIARIKHHGQAVWSIERDGQLYPLSAQPESLAELLDIRQHGLAINDRATPVVATQATFLAPVTRRCSIVCQGVNYLGHRQETAQPDRPAFNLLFSKADTSLTSGRGDILRPPHVQLLDYEIELGLVIGTRITRDTVIDSANWTDFVAGMVNANDISARDVQVPQGQWFKGKSYRTFLPVGPYLGLASRDELNRFGELRLCLDINGERRQTAVAEQMIFKPWDTLQEVSGLMDLYPGDLVLTGTPEGVAMRVPSRLKQRLAAALLSDAARNRIFVRSQLAGNRYLKDGDVITATIATPDGSLDLGEQILTIATD